MNLVTVIVLGEHSSGERKVIYVNHVEQGTEVQEILRDFPIGRITGDNFTIYRIEIMEHERADD